MNSKKIAIVIGILIIISIGGIFMMKKAKFLPARQTISTDILYITSPVNNFSGVVEKTGSDTILVSQNVTLSEMPPAIPPDANATIPPSPQPKKLSFTVKISDKTTVTRPPLNIPLLLVTPKPPTEQKLTIKDIKVGENITIQTDKDLRTLSQNQFEATSIELPGITNTLQGTITNVGTDRITLESMMPVPMPETNEKEYTVMLNADTEISYLPPPDKDQNQKPVKLAVSDLKKDMQVTVYTDVDVVKQQNVTALRIEPVLPSPQTELPPSEQMVANPTTVMTPPAASPVLETPTTASSPAKTSKKSPTPPPAE